MNYKSFYIDLLRAFFSGKINRKELSNRTALIVDIDIEYEFDYDLMRNCELGLRHSNEIDYYTKPFYFK